MDSICQMTLDLKSTEYCSLLFDMYFPLGKSVRLYLEVFMFSRDA